MKVIEPDWSKAPKHATHFDKYQGTWMLQASDGNAWELLGFMRMDCSGVMLNRPTRAPEEHSDTAGSCHWHYDDNGCWKGSCGIEWYFEDSGPEDNGVNYCPNCGKPCVVEEDGEAE